MNTMSCSDQRMTVHEGITLDLFTTVQEHTH
jgi:hypothetical protein